MPAIALPLGALLAMYAGALLLQTGAQAHIWSSDELMRMNSVAFHPESRRANINMAVLQARYGALDEALEYSQRVAELKLERKGDKSVRDLLLSCYANTPLPQETFTGLPLWQAQERIISRTNAFHFLVKDLQNGQCPAIDAVAIAQGFESVLLADGASAWALAEVYAGLAVLENSLQRHEQGLAYAVLFEQSAPANPRALLMQLHFASALGREEVVSSAIEQLSWLRDAGELNRQQRDTLALYTEEEHAAD